MRSPSLTRITVNELYSLLEDWVLNRSDIEEDWDNFEELVRLVDQRYIGGMVQFLVDSFAEM